MTNTFKENFDIVIKCLTLIGSAIAFIFTIITWDKQNQIKRADFLENKIKEFQEPSTFIARKILDGYASCDTCNNKSNRISDEEMISKGSTRKNDSTDIKFENLDKTLNEILPSTNISKQRVRQSFDNLLDFFGKIEYYISLKLMTKYEANYFLYYIQRCYKNEAVMNYAKNYGFVLFISLTKRLDL
jgi:hypothetical protein